MGTRKGAAIRCPLAYPRNLPHYSAQSGWSNTSGSGFTHSSPCGRHLSKSSPRYNNHIGLWSDAVGEEKEGEAEHLGERHIGAGPRSQNQRIAFRILADT